MNWWPFRRKKRYVPDPRVAVLASELQIAARALDAASAAMKHQRVTPLVTNTTKSASRRAMQTLESLDLPHDDDARRNDR